MQMDGAEPENGKHHNMRDAALKFFPVHLSHTDNKKGGRLGSSQGPNVPTVCGSPLKNEVDGNSEALMQGKRLSTAGGYRMCGVHSGSTEQAEHMPTWLGCQHPCEPEGFNSSLSREFKTGMGVTEGLEQRGWKSVGGYSSRQGEVRWDFWGEGSERKKGGVASQTRRRQDGQFKVKEVCRTKARRLKKYGLI